VVPVETLVHSPAFTSVAAPPFRQREVVEQATLVAHVTPVGRAQVHLQVAAGGANVALSYNMTAALS
jgi:hypothetical protein